MKDYPGGIKVTRVTADAVVSVTPGKLWGWMISSAAAESIIALHDDEDAADAATIVGEAVAIAGTARGASVSVMLPKPVDSTIISPVRGTEPMIPAKSSSFCHHAYSEQ